MPPSRVQGRYELKSKIGEGGMGVVYRAYDPPPTNRDVALKTLHPFSDPRASELFYRECEVLRSIRHPNIVEIFDMGEFEEGGAKMPFLVMPLLMGRPLDELIRNPKHELTVARVIDIISQVCRGLEAAHERGLVHRLLKPSNVFVMDDESVKIIDFGVVHAVDARSRSNGFRKGALLYMAPEQVQSRPATPHSDIFSLGVVAYEALTRRQPFRGAREQDVINAILNENPPPASEINPAVSETISRVVHRAMAKQPGRRFSSARELSDVLERALRNEPIELFDPTRFQPRLERAQKAFENGDYEFAYEIVNELEAEGNIDSGMTLLKAKIERAMRQKTISQLLEGAKARFEEDEDPLALEKIQQILQLDPKHAAALGLKSKVEKRSSERQIDSWMQLAEQHVANRAYGHAREALESVLRIRPMDTRASRLLAQVEISEQEYLKLSAEKAQSYQTAFNHWKNGEVTQALSHMDLVLELDRRAPDSTSEEGQTYQSFYNAVRSEHEAMNNAYAAARHAIAQEDFDKALAACNVYLTRYPSNALFQGFKLDIEEQRRRRLSAYIAQIDSQLEAEPDLDAKAEILRGALARYPGEPHFERSLKLVNDKRNSIVLRARQIVRTEIDRLQKKREQRARDAARAEWIKRIDRSLERGEYAASLELVAKAQQEFAGDRELGELEKLALSNRERAEQVERLVAAGRDLCAQGSLDEGLTRLRQALALDERSSAAKNALVAVLVEAGQKAVLDDWRRAESFVQKALDLDPLHTAAKNLRSQISDRRADEEIGQLLSRARKLESAGELGGAMDEVKKGLSKYPSDARIAALRETLEREIAHTRLKAARLSDLEEIKTLSLRARAARPDELESIRERTRRVAIRYPEEAEFQSIAAEVERIARERAARTIPKQELASPVRPPVRQQEHARPDRPSVLPQERVRPDRPSALQQERMRPDRPSVLQQGQVPLDKPPVVAAIPKQVLWVAGAVFFLVLVFVAADRWLSKSAGTGQGPVSAYLPSLRTEDANSSARSIAQGPPTRMIGPQPPRLEMRDLEPGSAVIIDGKPAGKVNPGGAFSSDVPEGDHQITLLARNQKLRVISRSFRRGSTVPVSGKDFDDKGSYPPRGNFPASLSPGDELAGNQGKDSSRIGDLKKIVGDYLNNVSGRGDPSNPNGNSPSANVAKPDFQAVMSSTDPAVLGDFLSKNPSGEFHDRVAERLDDLMWANTESGDMASLNTYVNRFPDGRHVDEARTQIAALTRASLPKVEPKTERTLRTPVDDKSALLKLILQYQQAYQTKSVDQLKALLPNIGKRQVRALNDFFGHTQLIKLDCRVSGDPVIVGDNATLKFTQTLTYIADTENNTVSSKLIMHLRKQPADSGMSDWRIESIR